MKNKIIKPQTSDMGCGFGEIEGAAGSTLKEVLEFCATEKTYGCVTIYRKFKIPNSRKEIVRKFDYDLYNHNIFYHNLSGWEYSLIVKEAIFDYCFMSKNIEIYLEEK